MREEQIKHMVSRFLQWRLPDDFSPDAGISFEPDYNVGTKYQGKHEPVGTNLFTATQATAMVRYMLADMPPPEPESDEAREAFAAQILCAAAGALIPPTTEKDETP